MEKHEIKNFLNILVTERMKAKSRIEELRWVQEFTGKSKEKLINEELDRISNIDKMYKELEEKLKK